MIANSGGDIIKERYKFREDHNPINTNAPKLNDDKSPPSRFIIRVNSYWNMIKNDITFCLFILYMFVMPILTSAGKTLTREAYEDLGYFDLIFLADRIGDLFVSYINSNGT